MIVLVALFGFFVGWLLEMAGDYLLRFSNTPLNLPVFELQRPALFKFNKHVDGVELGFEMLTAGISALLYVLHGLSPASIVLIAVYSFFALIALMDYKYHLILNILTYPGLLVALGINLLVLHQPVLSVLLGIGFGFGVFFLVARVKPDGLGGGDIKMAALIGAALGFPNVLWALMVAVAASAIAIIFLFIARHGKPEDTIPYGPFLSLGVMIVLLITL